MNISKKQKIVINNEKAGMLLFETFMKPWLINRAGGCFLY
jgi:hypothetical protein